MNLSDLLLTLLCFILFLIIVMMIGKHLRNHIPGKKYNGGAGFFGKIIERHADKNFIELAQEPDIETLFADGADRGRLKVTKEGLYSITTPRLAKLIVDTIESEFGSIKGVQITDATAGMGGDTITFAKNGATVNAVEKSPLNFEALMSNVEAYNVGDKINLINDDYVKIMKDLKQDIIFADPPWTGLDYKSAASLPLELSGKDIGDIITEIKENCKMVVLKVPNNFAFKEFQEKHPAAKLHELQKFKLITLRV